VILRSLLALNLDEVKKAAFFFLSLMAAISATGGDFAGGFFSSLD
jgi:hypothetical protein